MSVAPLLEAVAVVGVLFISTCSLLAHCSVPASVIFVLLQHLIALWNLRTLWARVDLFLLVLVKAGFDMLESEDPQPWLAVHQNLLPPFVFHVFLLLHTVCLLRVIHLKFEFLTLGLFLLWLVALFWRRKLHLIFWIYRIPLLQQDPFEIILHFLRWFWVPILFQGNRLQVQLLIATFQLDLSNRIMLLIWNL